MCLEKHSQMSETIKQLQQENQILKERLQAAEELIDSLNEEKKNGKENGLLTKAYFDLVSRDHMYRILIENMSEGALVINNQHVILYSNKHFASFSGYPLQKIMGADFNSFLGKKDEKKFSACMSEAKAQRSFCEITLKTKKPEGTPILVSITSFHMGTQVFYCLILIDVSAQKKITKNLEYKVEERNLRLAAANRRLSEIIHELSEVNKYLDNFVHAIAHDLRAPVANLKLVKEMYQMAPEEEKPKLMESIHNNINRLDSTLKGLVQIIHTQGNKETNKPGINVVQIIREVLEEQKQQIKAKNIRIDIDEKTNQTINYVEGYIRSIARNMISNAIKYSRPGSDPRLKIVFEKNDDCFILRFNDNGKGIDLDKHRKNLFKPFQRFAPEEKGMGIGLHIVNNMVQKNGGHIDVESKPEKGIKFTVHLKEYQV